MFHNIIIYEKCAPSLWYNIYLLNQRKKIHTMIRHMAFHVKRVLVHVPHRLLSSVSMFSDELRDWLMEKSHS